MTDNLVFGPIQTHDFTVGFLYFLGKPGVLDGEGDGSRYHTQQLDIGLIKDPFFLIDGA